MPVNLNKPIQWTKANADEAAMLQDLQGNILKGHGRDHTRNFFLHFNDGAEGRKFLKKVAPLVVSTAKQLKAAADRRASMKKKQDPKDAGPFVSVLLSAGGYKALGTPTGQIPKGEAFRSGMVSRGTLLSDPAPDSWDEHFRKAPIHAMVLAASDSLADLDAATAQITRLLPASVQVLGIETGAAVRNALGVGIEHFGYVDGRSQPLALVEDIERERDEEDGISVWNPGQILKRVIVPCPGGQSKNSFGSYFVFRKLEQDVKGFKEAEEALAAQMKLTGADEERAGALVVGRFEDGTPVVLQKADGMHNSVPNNFTYKDDPGGNKCPFHAHIRKVNPRGESVGTFAADETEERSHMIFRRGIPYGERAADLTDLPSGGVGLLFMCFQSSIENQFEFMQTNWANNPGFVKAGAGVDPIIGQTADGQRSPQLWPAKWGGDQKKVSATFEQFVHLKGGEYFFAPSISFLKSL